MTRTFLLLLPVTLIMSSCTKQTVLPDQAQPIKAMHSDPDRAIENCRAAFKRIAMQSLEPNLAVQAYLDECKELYVEKDCRQAFIDLSSVSPERKSASIVEACTRAYCPKLAKPKPQLCKEESPSQSTLASMMLWQELHWAILIRDLGIERAGFIFGALASMQLLLEPIVIAPDLQIQLPKSKNEQTHIKELVLEVNMKKGSCTITWMVDDKHQNIEVSHKPTAKDLKPLLDAIGDELANTQVFLRAEKDLPYANIVEMMNSLRNIGFSRFAFVTKSTK